MAERLSYLIIGNGIAGATAAEILRAEDSAATIAVIGDDPFPVYYRPALKDYLAGRVREDKLWARPTSFYQDHNIYFLPDRVTGINAAQHSTLLQSKRQIRYERLLLASGARPAQLRCPGSNFKGVTTLRSIAEYQAVQERLNNVRRVVVTGSGTLALETVETLRHCGYEVTHLIRRQKLWSEVLDATASDLVLQQERRDGVDVYQGEEIAEITGNNGEVSGVVTTQGSRIACEMVIVAIGVEPNIDFIRASGIACGRGVRVDNRMRTNTPDIYAAGDVLETVDPTTGRTRIIGQWYPAIQQARAAAYSMLDVLDSESSFQFNTFYNATILYGLEFASVGVTNVPGYQEVIADPEPRTYRKVLLKEGIPIGMLALGNRKQAQTIKRAIDHRVNLLPIVSRLFANDFQLSEWLDNLGVPPPLLGVSRFGDQMSSVAGNNTTMKQAAKVQRQSVNSGKVGVVGRKREENIVVGSRSIEQIAQEKTVVGARLPSEAFLVHMAQPEVNLRLPEARLSQTGVTVIGRQPGVQLLIDEGSVSRRHAEISYANGQYLLSDVGSSNGTFVNEQRLGLASAYALKPNDQLRFGNIVTCLFLLRPVSRPLSNQQNKPAPVGSVSMAGIMKSREMEASEERVAQGQPMVNPDGSLQLSGATASVPAAIVEAFKAYPALVVLTVKKDGKRSPLVYLLKRGKSFTIGRDKECNIELADMVVSRRHAEVFPGPQGHYIRDLGSSNGVMVNQTRLANPYLLAHGDRIAMGSTLIYFIDLQSGWKQTEALPASGRPVVQASTRPMQAKQEAKGKGRLPTMMAQDIQLSTPIPQVTICRQCGVANAKVARFCAGCSSPLGS